MSSTAQLEVEIEAENRVNSLIKDYAPGILANAKALQGRPVFKVDGTLRKDAKAILDIPELPGRHDQIFLSRNSYFLAFTFKTCCHKDNPEPYSSDYCAYAETTVYIGDMENGVLATVNDDLINEHRSDYTINEYRSDYTLEEVLAKRAACAEAKKAYEEARSACNPFGEGR